MNRVLRTTFSLCAVILSIAAMTQSVNGEWGDDQETVLVVDVPGVDTTKIVRMPMGTPELDSNVRKAQLAAIYSMTLIRVEVIRDPSVAYAIDVTNTTEQPGDYLFRIDLPIPPLSANTTWGELNVELIDANGNGTAFLHGNYGQENAIQGASIFSTFADVSEPIGTPLGQDIAAPGLYTFPLAEFPGPTPENGDILSILTRFTLSPGDNARLTSRFIIDEGTGIPFAEIPELPDPADGPYFNVINVDSPETSLGDNFFIGSQTQLNVSEGGSIGSGFNFHAFMTNQLNDRNVDVEMNITGGTVGHQFMALSNTTVNISGGTVEGIFIAGDYNGQGSNVKVNITGGSVGRGFSGWLQVYAGSVVNISDGTLGR